MKLIFHKILSWLMAFVVLFSTMFFTIDMHYCGNTLVDTAIFKKANTCKMKAIKTSSESGCSAMKKNCCSSEQIVVDGQDELKISSDKIAFEKQLILASFIYTYIKLFEGYDKEVTTFKEYKPPLVIRQIYKLDETYLI